jgi:hypothetical protein
VSKGYKGRRLKLKRHDAGVDRHNPGTNHLMKLNRLAYEYNRQLHKRKKLR